VIRAIDGTAFEAQCPAPFSDSEFLRQYRFGGLLQSGTPEANRRRRLERVEHAREASFPARMDSVTGAPVRCGGFERRRIGRRPSVCGRPPQKEEQVDRFHRLMAVSLGAGYARFLVGVAVRSDPTLPRGCKRLRQAWRMTGGASMPLG
jgi:hypothetical protein